MSGITFDVSLLAKAPSEQAEAQGLPHWSPRLKACDGDLGAVQMLYRHRILTNAQAHAATGKVFDRAIDAILDHQRDMVVAEQVQA